MSPTPSITTSSSGPSSSSSSEDRNRRQLYFNGALLTLTSSLLVAYSYAFARHVKAGLRSDLWDELVWVATLCSTLFYYQAFSQAYASYQRRRVLEIPTSATGTPRPNVMYDASSSGESAAGRLLRMAFRPIPGIQVGSWVINSPAIGSNSPSRPGGAFSPRMSFDPESQQPMTMLSEHERPQRPSLPSWLFGQRASAADDAVDDYSRADIAPGTPSLMVSPPTPSTPLPSVAGGHASQALPAPSRTQSGLPVTPGDEEEIYRSSAMQSSRPTPFNGSPKVSRGNDSDEENTLPAESRRTLTGLGMGDVGDSLEGKTSVWMSPRRTAVA